jgi:hypothetical protein
MRFTLLTIWRAGFRARFHPRINRAGAAVALACAVVTSAPISAATISIEKSTRFDQPNLVVVEGEFAAGDDAVFASRTAPLSRALIVLESNGGNLVAGVKIGEAIRFKGFSTLVVDRCASACALAWLGGVQRFMSDKGRVGFHPAYNGKSGQETGVGNAIVGAYLNKIGLSYAAVIYITTAPPTSMTWVTIEEAKKNGIDVTLLNTAADEPPKWKIEKVVSDFVISFYDNLSTPNAKALQFLTTVYGDDVFYFGKHLPRAAVLDDQKQFAERWPTRSYRVRPDTLQVECFEPTRPVPYPFCNAVGQLDWKASSDTRVSTGVASFQFSIMSQEGRLIIWSQDSKVLQRDITRAPAPATAKSAASVAKSSTLSYDEVAMVLGTLLVGEQQCGLKGSSFPLNVAVAKLGQDLVDFVPGNRYAPLVEVKAMKAREFHSRQREQSSLRGHAGSAGAFSAGCLPALSPDISSRPPSPRHRSA